MITKERKVVEIKVNNSKPFMVWNDGIYKIEKESVNLHANEHKINPIAEILFFEDNPIPFGSKGTGSILTEVVVRNALENVVDKRPMSFSWLRKIFNPMAILGLVIVSVVVYTLLQGGSLI